MCATAVAALIALATAATADPEAQLARVRVHFDELDYELVLDAAIAVVTAPDATDAQRAEALYLRGAALVVLDRPADAAAAFDALLAIDPERRPPADAPPRIRAAFESARAAWRVRREEELAIRHGAQLGRVKLAVDPPAAARGGRPFTVRLHLTDPDRLAARVVLGYRRESDRDYSIVSAPAAAEVALTVPGAVLASDRPYRLAWYVHAVHASGAVLRRRGDDAEPAWHAVAAGRVPRPPPLTRRWWFWTGAAALAVSAVVVPVLIVRSQDVGPQRIVVGP